MDAWTLIVVIMPRVESGQLDGDVLATVVIQDCFIDRNNIQSGSWKK